MEPAPVDSEPHDRLSRRGRRAIALGAITLLLIALGGFGYVRSTSGTNEEISTKSVNPAMVTGNPITYYFVTPSLGWAVENVVTPSTRAGQFRVYRTSDSARHWQMQLVGQSSFAGFVPMSVQFFDQMHGFIAVEASTGQLYRTADAGTTWQQVQLPSARADYITFSSPNNGWLLVGDPTSTLYVTEDAGNTWRPIPDPPAGSDSLMVRTSSEIWLGSFTTPAPRAYLSTDGAVTWYRRNLPYPSQSTAGSSVQGPGDETVWPTSNQYQTLISLLPGTGVLASVFCECPQNTFFTFVSFDQGLTWRYAPPAPGLVAYQDDFHWWTISARTLYRSSDGGLTWSKVVDNLPDWQFVPHAIDSRHAWALIFVPGGYGLALTSDGGGHWTPGNVPRL